MRKRKFIITIVLLTVLLHSSCSRNTNIKEVDLFKKYVKTLNNDYSTFDGRYFVIPIDVCPACIKKTKHYINSIDNNRDVFILIGRSKKMIRLTFSSEIIEKANVWIDEQGLFYDNPLNENLIQLFHFDDNELTKRTLLYPNNLETVLYD